MDNDRQFLLKYSQNFLKSQKLVKRIIEQAEIDSKDLVYEIGPGGGIITESLARRCAKVIAIEKDRNLYKKLRKKFSGIPSVEIKLGDFLKYNLPQRKRYKIFSNIPFNLTAEIVRKITSATNLPQDAYLIIQEEAAKKFTGYPYGKESQYSLLLKPWFAMKITYRFKRTDFYPIPKVDIVLLRIKKRETPKVKKEYTKLYCDFIVYGFNQWKPTLARAFKKIFTYEQFKRLSKNLKFALSARSTDLIFEQWLGLFNYFLIGVEASKQNIVEGAEQRLKKQQARLKKIHRTRL